MKVSKKVITQKVFEMTEEEYVQVVLPCLRYCLHRLRSEKYCGIHKTGVTEKKITNIIE